MQVFFSEKWSRKSASHRFFSFDLFLLLKLKMNVMERYFPRERNTQYKVQLSGNSSKQRTAYSIKLYCNHILQTWYLPEIYIKAGKSKSFEVNFNNKSKKAMNGRSVVFMSVEIHSDIDVPYLRRSISFSVTKELRRNFEVSIYIFFIYSSELTLSNIPGLR